MTTRGTGGRVAPSRPPEPRHPMKDSHQPGGGRGSVRCRTARRPPPPPPVRPTWAHSGTWRPGRELMATTTAMRCVSDGACLLRRSRVSMSFGRRSRTRFRWRSAARARPSVSVIARRAECGVPAPAAGARGGGEGRATGGGERAARDARRQPSSSRSLCCGEGSGSVPQEGTRRGRSRR